MKIAILSMTVCLPTRSIINYFREKNLEINCVIIEKNFRKKFSDSEKIFRASHDKYNMRTKKYSFIRRLTRRVWDISPISLRKFITINIGTIPVIKKVSTSDFCKRNNIDFYEVKKHSSKEVEEILKSRTVKYLLIVSSNWLLKEPIISMENTKIINAHSGWLPKHKGLDSIPWSILENDPIGLTTHYIDAGIDSGDILKFYQIEIDDGDNYNIINQKIGNLQPFAFWDTLNGLANREILPVPQDNKHKPHTPMSYEQLCKAAKALSNL